MCGLQPKKKRLIKFFIMNVDFEKIAGRKDKKFQYWDLKWPFEKLAKNVSER
jgi:hypothetical protein